MLFKERMEEDVKYAREESLRKDVYIIIKIFGVVIGEKGAY